MAIKPEDEAFNDDLVVDIGGSDQKFEIHHRN